MAQSNIKYPPGYVYQLFIDEKYIRTFENPDAAARTGSIMAKARLDANNETVTYRVNPVKDTGVA